MGNTSKCERFDHGCPPTVRKQCSRDFCSKMSVWSARSQIAEPRVQHTRKWTEGPQKDPHGSQGTPGCEAASDCCGDRYFTMTAPLSMRSPESSTVAPAVADAVLPPRDAPTHVAPTRTHPGDATASVFCHWGFQNARQA